MRRIQRAWIIGAPLVAALPFGGYSQQAEGGSVVSFEAVSVRRSGSAVYVMSGPGSVTVQSSPFRYSGEHVTCDLPLRDVLKEAFSINEDYRIAGPEWISTESYRIQAVAPRGTTRDVARLMLQAMLRERFGLQYHRAQREWPAYALIQAAGGFKLRPVDTARARERVIETPMGPRSGVASAQEPGRFTAPAISLHDLCSNFLSHQMDAPVLDMTNVEGRYEIDLRWDWDRETARSGLRRNDPELLRAMERQLGLKLEKRKLAIEMLVIDHLEKTPIEN